MPHPDATQRTDPGSGAEAAMSSARGLPRSSPLQRRRFQSRILLSAPPVLRTPEASAAARTGPLCPPGSRSAKGLRGAPRAAASRRRSE